MNDRWDEALQSLGAEPLDEGLAREVRQAVAARIRRERRMRWVWAGAAAAALAVAGMWSGARVEPPSAPAAPPVLAKAPAAREVAAAPVAVQAKDLAPRQQRRRAVAPAAEPMRIQMLTDDPDLVIIWLVGEETGGGE